MSKKAERKLRDLFARLDALYTQIPKVNCKGLCSIACGPIPLSDLEAKRLHLVTHTKPRIVDDLRCVYLKESRCSAYRVRPLMCRAWGVMKSLSCMHGCVPDHWFPEEEFVRIATEIERLSGKGRILRTDERGLTHLEGDSFERFSAAPRRDSSQIEADAERTRSLRALHGGRIMWAGENPEIRHGGYIK